MSDKLRWVFEGRVRRVDLDLSNDRRHVAGDACFSKRVVERLLNHVANPSRSRGYQNSERQRLDMCAGNFVADELVANLRSIAVDDAEMPSITRKIHNHRQAFPCVAKLVSNSRSLAWR